MKRQHHILSAKTLPSSSLCAPYRLVNITTAIPVPTALISVLPVYPLLQTSTHAYLTTCQVPSLQGSTQTLNSTCHSKLLLCVPYLRFDPILTDLMEPNILPWVSWIMCQTLLPPGSFMSVCILIYAYILLSKMLRKVINITYFRYDVTSWRKFLQHPLLFLNCSINF